jgi:hypothetical protein
MGNANTMLIVDFFIQKFVPNFANMETAKQKDVKVDVNSCIQMYAALLWRTGHAHIQNAGFSTLKERR